MAPIFKSAKYTEKLDKVADKKLTKNLSSSQKKKFEALDKKHKKVKTMAQDRVIDKKIISKVKKAGK
jgi:predicted nucleic acid-binding OB-fold protein